MDNYDMVILGGGLAGLTLGLQLKRARPETTIFIAEKREGRAAEAAFKVGESTVELSAHYFADVVGMRDHMEKDELPKSGLRFFFPAGDNSDITRRVEWGGPRWPPVNSFQLDRGRFENELGARNLAIGNDLVAGSRVEDVELDGDGHRVTVSTPAGTRVVTGRWLVDATGRAFTLKRKLGMDPKKDDGHHVNSAWFRLAGGLDIESLSEDPKWRGRLVDAGLRKFSTNHLMGEGYWVWLIPLASGPISIGIVTDAHIHSFDRIDTLDRALDWLREHEPQLAAVLAGRRHQVEDFLKVADFSYGCDQVYSRDRWCLTGEAGAFLDPLYSPGSDFIAMSNTFITDIVTRDLAGEDVAERVDAHNRRFLRMFDIVLRYYLGQYHLFGNAQVICVKLLWDYAFYWAFEALWFFSGKLTDLEFMAAVSEEYERVVGLNERMQQLFRDWHTLDDRRWEGLFVTLFPYVFQTHAQLHDELDDAGLRERCSDDAAMHEAFAVAVFAKVAELLPDVSLDRATPIDPYAMSAKPDRWEADGLFEGGGVTIDDAMEKMQGVQMAWLDVRTATGMEYPWMQQAQHQAG